MIRENITIGNEYPLKGLLTLPDDLSNPVSAVVFVHGSGASDMDERVMKLTPFKDLSEALAERGIASVRYDKRTYTYRKQLARVKNMTVREETIEDAVMATESLRKDPRIDRDRIFIVGHSMGGMLAPRIDAEGGCFRGIIMMAGSPYRMEDIVIRQLQQTSGSNAILRWIVNLEYKIFARKFDNLYQMSDEEAQKKKFAGNLSLYYFKEMGLKTASQYLLEHEKPILILQGGMDFQVLAEDDFRKFQEELAGRNNTSFKLYPQLNHCFVQGIYNDILKAQKEYSVERHIPEEVPNDIAEFIKNS